MKTAEQIVTYLANSKSALGFECEVLVPHLSYELAKDYLKSTVTPEQWRPIPLDREQVLQDMADYMVFAWDKARNHRGLSAGRSVEKMQAWDWLLSDAGQELNFDELEYQNYGAPILKAVCEKYGFPIPEGTDLQNMMAGRSCTPDCDSGCGVG